MPLCRLLLVVSPPASNPRIAQSRLRRRGRRRDERMILVTGAAFPPASVCVLNRAQPFSGAEDVRFAVALAGGPQSAQREKCSVNVVNAPPSVPTSIGFLRPLQILDTPP